MKRLLALDAGGSARKSAWPLRPLHLLSLRSKTLSILATLKRLLRLM
jgi:hypothetical protein